MKDLQFYSATGVKERLYIGDNTKSREVSEQLQFSQNYVRLMNVTIPMGISEKKPRDGHK